MSQMLPPAANTLPSGSGSLNKNDFKLITNLGQGSFGKVYKVSHIPSGHEYAIKVISKEKTKSPSMMKQIQNEIGIMQSINHPCIVKMLTYFENDSNIYLVLELGGQNLYAALFKEKKFAEPKAAKVVVANTVRF